MNVDTFVSDRWKATDDRNICLYMNGKRKIKPNSNKPLSRNLYIISRKRKIHDIHLYINTLVVVDKSIRNQFGSVNKMRKHVKTLMKSAAKHYLHESLTRYHLRIHLVLSKIVLLKREIKFDPSKEGILDFACSIMNRIEKREERTFDHKLFLTRNEFGSGGLGRGNGMCDRNQSCSMARDDYSSVIIAHEIAHTFGVNHDKYFENSQEIMSPELNNRISDPHWSIQSRNSLIRLAKRYSCIDKTKTSNGWHYNNDGLNI
ncbi:A disintegrin and metalloproteinase with thrombospondin motifs 2-like [Xenia sp. Carnegie-2017]|uniref:A disintegrin and metalloproteinase with thrombospondin motifs 2-like n=1 Tax=Xenia sp. Carnegie-2017 TaxID=2897299 RepID=UPI001F039B00|nr:A disintegrin and metalloproteinase with thrombospondin motifs 2-like [Xenia sp. Carnegie-2017]